MSMDTWDRILFYLTTIGFCVHLWVYHWGWF
jgi:hypothetical protein